jgi:uncharacterized membrane protein YfcA
MDFVASLPNGELATLAAYLALGGVVAGILAGLFGVGGGAIIVPVLAELFDHFGVPDEVAMPLAVGTSLAIIIPTSLRSFASHRARGSVDEAALRAWILPAAAGAVTGAAIASSIGSDALRMVFALFAVSMAANLLFGREHWRLAENLPSRPVVALWGFLIAVLSALIGIGGGALGVLFLTLYNRPIHEAVGTTAGLGALIAVPGAIAYAVAGLPHLGDLPVLSVGFVSVIGFALMAPISVLTAPIGVRIAHGLTKRQLRLAFGLFLATVSTRFFWEVLG